MKQLSCKTNLERFLVGKNVEEPSKKGDLALIMKSFYVDARKKDGSKNIEICTQLTLQSSTKFRLHK